MISNKYGFIFIHTPKTGGTSVSLSFHRDLDMECRMKLEDSGGIAHIIPNEDDFPWWTAWADHSVDLNNFCHEREMVAVVLPQSADVGFGFCNGGCAGNIKHFTFCLWGDLLEDPRIRHYHSFLEKYEIVGSQRNPYDREFSGFLYHNHADLIEKTAAIKNSAEVFGIINAEWKEYATTVAPTSYGEKGQRAFSGYPRQMDYLIRERRDGAWLAPSMRIRFENLEEDYDRICNNLGIKRKDKNFPHTVNTRKKWKKYLPHDIMELYDDELLELIHKDRPLDFDLLGYKKRT